MQCVCAAAERFKSPFAVAFYEYTVIVWSRNLCIIHFSRLDFAFDGDVPHSRACVCVCVCCSARTAVVYFCFRHVRGGIGMGARRMPNQTQSPLSVQMAEATRNARKQDANQ